ncbi:MBL fold metallo-hydrolase [Clostridium sp. SYSU_GA19001]|uniref:MBL fold metallo-hydrolase n=1 Tax=Clostridium caldaquaticum TaxID=2940653 RepID=UPI002076EE04|nr:MBL fold metallo-hydrolase [Clostridium caldaquaticum]MCM8710446.1 MBL fold metallo-hydrolase [Clostridium caldaquaticum]
MQVKRIPVGSYAANCYILIDESTKECAVIDPGGDGEELIKYIDELQVNVKLILLTHGHADHTGAVGQLKERFKVSAHIHKNDGDFINSGEFMFGPLKYKGETVILNTDVTEESIFKVGNLVIKAIETPGHTLGGVCYLVEDKIFTGDTLFLRSIGRTDLIGGDFFTLINSIKNKLLVLDEDINVFPGHGPQTTIKYERENNPFI